MVVYFLLSIFLVTIIVYIFKSIYEALKATNWALTIDLRDRYKAILLIKKYINMPNNQYYEAIYGFKIHASQSTMRKIGKQLADHNIRFSINQVGERRY